MDQEVLAEQPPACTDAERAAWVMVGHSTVLLQLPRFNILFDPIWSERCSPLSWLGPRRARRPALAFESLPPIDAVLLSHDHYDHCDRPTLMALAEQHDPLFVVGRGVADHLQRWGLEKYHELEWWESLSLNAKQRSLTSEGEVASEASADLEVQFLPARHFSGRKLSDRNQSLWGGFWLSFRSAPSALENVYYCGDTGFDAELFGKIRRRKGAPDLAFLPVGAYDPEWFMSVVHCNPEEALQLHMILESRRSVAMHCGTFQLTDEAIDDPTDRLQRAIAEEHKAGVSGVRNFTSPSFGERQTLADELR